MAGHMAAFETRLGKEVNPVQGVPSPPLRERRRGSGANASANKRAVGEPFSFHAAAAGSAFSNPGRNSAAPGESLIPGRSMR